MRLLQLADAMNAVEGLEFSEWVPVDVEQEESRTASERNGGSADFYRQKHDLRASPLLVERICSLLPKASACFRK